MKYLWGPLVFVHRWLGIAGCLLFIPWFASGIAMMYVRMPELTDEERFAHAKAIDAERVRVSLAEAAAVAGVDSPDAAQLMMLGERPVYRFGGQRPVSVFADRAKALDGLTRDEALDLARGFAPEHSASLGYVSLLEIPDQWTIQARAHFPLHLIAFGDRAGTEIYLSNRTGDVVMETTRKERVLAYAGPVAHWLYLPVLRRNGPLWTDVIIWSSIAGCVLCVTGLVAGVLRFSPASRYQIRGGRVRSPYAGWLKWHHYAGLLFGVITFTWVFSGLLSMGPFPLLSSGGATPEQRRAVRGELLSLDSVSLDHTKASLLAAGRVLKPKELSFFQFRGRPYWTVRETASRLTLVPAAESQPQPFSHFDYAEIEAVARDAAPASIANREWIDRYDAYYYDRSGERSLPVLRVKYNDPQETWIYIDPSRGTIAQLVRRRDRVNRWLYHGLHSFDFPLLYQSRPAWDVLLIALSLGGVASAITSLVPGWRRLRRRP